MRFYVHKHNSGYYGMSRGMTKSEAIGEAEDWTKLGGDRLAIVTRGQKGPDVFAVSSSFHATLVRHK